MSKQVKAIPEGFHTVTPRLVVNGADKAIEFYKKAFGAIEVMRAPGPDGKSIIHSQLTIGDSQIFVIDECPEMKALSPERLEGIAVGLQLYVKDVDALFNQALTAGAKVAMPVSDMFWGDRFGCVIDPFGHSWSLATHIEDPTPEVIQQRMKETCAGL